MASDSTSQAARHAADGSLLKDPAAGERPFPRFGPYLLLIALSGIAYVNAGHSEFFFDSVYAITENPVHQHPGESFALLWARPWMPDQSLTQFTFALNHALNRALGLPGFHVASFLVTNVVIHALNACLLFLFLRGLLRTVDPREAHSSGIALAAAAIFAVHPLHASTVVYTLQRRGELVLTMHLLALLAYLRARPGAALPAGRWKWALIASIPLCYWLSCRAKSVGMILPALILILEACLRAGRPGAMRRFAPVLAGCLAVWLAATGVFLWRLNLLNPGSLNVRFSGTKELWSAWAHFLTECRVLVTYWNMLLLPLPGRLSIDHDFAVSTSLMRHGAVFAMALHVLLLSLALVAARWGWPLASAGIFWFYATLTPFMLLPQAELLVEYKTYPASVGLFLVLVDALRKIRPRLAPAGRFALCAVPVAILLAITLRRNVVYQNDFNLWTDAVAKNPNRARCHASLGNALLKLGRTREAVARYEEAVRLLPEYHPAILNIANQLSAEGRLAEANERYRRVLEIDSGYAPAHNNWAVNLRKENRNEEAVAHFREALRLKPTYFDAHYNLAAALSALGRNDEAVAEVREALRINPESVNGHLRLARLLVGVGRGEEAIAHYQAVVRLMPDFAEARLDLGNCLLDQARPAEAVEEFQRAVALRPDLAEARNCLGSALLAMNEIAAAVASLREAIRLDPRQVNARINLGLTFEAAGRLDDAERAYTEALAISPAHPEATKRLAGLRTQQTSGPAPAGG